MAEVLLWLAYEGSCNAAWAAARAPFPPCAAALTGPTAALRAAAQGERVVSALGGGAPQRAWALNALCLLSFRQELHLAATPGLLAALLPVRRRTLLAASQAAFLAAPRV